MDLYHYTDVHGLENILKSRKIRFTSLKYVDCKSENLSSNLFDYGSNIFVSCFTIKNEESVELWNTNSEYGQGVRLKFQKDLINGFTKKYKREDIKYIVHGDGKIYKVEYTNDQEKIYPKIFQKNNIGKGVFLQNIGKYKNLSYKLEEEWRYKLIVCSYLERNNGNYCMLEKVPIDHYDVDINKEALYNMEVTIGYNVKIKEKDRIYKLINEYNNENFAQIICKESVLK
ncbi:hypothetical protein ACH36K_10925 [Clostridium sp. MB05]|jgi:hypothetical protein